MITGTVNANLEPQIRLEVFRDSSFSFTLSFDVDTGFSDYTSLPTDVITALGLRFKRFGRLVLADNSIVTSRIYEVTVIWHGQPLLTEAYEMERPNLVGMALLRGSKLTVEAEDGGIVLIEPNP